MDYTYDSLLLYFKNYSTIEAIDVLSTMLLNQNLSDIDRDELVKALIYFTKLRDFESIGESMNEPKTGYGFIYTPLSGDDEKKLKRVCSDIGLTIIVPDLHMTLMFDKSNPRIEQISSPISFIATVKSIKILGEYDSKWRSIALELDCPDASTYHKTLKTAGYKHSYDNFIPHMSLKYLPSQEDIEIINKFELYFKSLILEFNGVFRNPVNGD